jgi:hypothetical protein
MVSGEIQVVGESQVSIPLKKRPRFVEVRFTEDDRCYIPCVPGFDELEWEIVETVSANKKRTFTLLISWEVVGERTISWRVDF